MYETTPKRLLDLFVAVTALILLAPLLVVTALAILIVDGRPILFRQQRVGRAGREFEFLKFRSMPQGTKSVASDELDAVRISWVGRLIRRTNIDELPQLLNVLSGDMSIVGPRPPIPSQARLLELRALGGALDVRPGLTGLAQVSAYDGMSVEAKAKFDNEYSSNVTLVGDVRIILRTVTYLLKPPPVY